MAADVEAIENLADEFRLAHGQVEFPVDVNALAAAEEISVLEGEFGKSFDGRIEFRQEVGGGRFYLFHAGVNQPERPVGRVRFTIAHELGHYVLPEHRARLLAGQAHVSRTDFYSEKQTEREADAFASCLLLPRDLLLQEVRRRRGLLTLSEIMVLAKNRFLTSATSTALRYCSLSPEPCAAVLSENGRVIYAAISKDMKELGLAWIEQGHEASRETPTGRLVRAAREQEAAEGECDSSLWFDRGRGRRVYEEAAKLGDLGRILTLLSVDQDGDDE